MTSNIDTYMQVQDFSSCPYNNNGICITEKKQCPYQQNNMDFTKCESRKRKDRVVVNYANLWGLKESAINDLTQLLWS